MPYDAIVVLGGGLDTALRPSQVTMDRLNHALTLYGQGQAPRLIFSGKAWLLQEDMPSMTEARAMQAVALAAGIPASDIFLEEESLDTIGNAYFTKLRLLEPNKWRHICLVTSDYHQERADYVFRHVLGSTYEITSSGAESTISPDTLIKKKETEHKILAIVRGWLSVIPVGSHVHIEALLADLPGYSQTPKYSRESLKKTISS